MSAIPRVETMDVAGLHVEFYDDGSFFASLNDPKIPSVVMEFAEIEALYRYAKAWHDD